MTNMTQKVLYSTKPAPVLHWQDTDQFNYGAAPSDTATLDVTPAEWAKQDGNWYVVNGGLTQANPYAPTAAQLLNRAQIIQKALVNASCVAAMTGGFISSALGTANTYPSTLTDQQNLAASVVASLLPNLPSTWTTKFWVMDSAGVWTLTPHTAAQIQQVGVDGKAWITTQQETLAGLIAQIDAAQTVAAVQSVLWP